jgi:acetyl esterase/lipase
MIDNRECMPAPIATRRKFLSIPLGLPALSLPVFNLNGTLAAQSILDLPPPPAGEHIGYGPGEFQFGELRVPAGSGPHPAVIMIHGGYWRAAYDLKHIGHLCEALTRAGLATWSLEYRRLGNPGGGWPGTFDDVKAGAGYLTKIAKAKAIDLNRVISMGHSAGGQLALWVAKQNAITLRGVVALAPVADLRRAWELRLSGNVVDELLGGSPDEVPERYRVASPIQMVPLGVRQQVIHGAADDVAPGSISRAYIAAARKAGDDATLTEPLGAGHFELIDPRSQAWGAVRERALSLVK